MTGNARQPDVDALRKQAENLLSQSCQRKQVQPLLERIIDLSHAGSDSSLFAHRHLAELLLEHNSWRAAKHLREVIKFDPRDDVAQALLGLCHTLMGNYFAAASAYRKALQVAPRNPWYHHNLGHLLDVALGQSREAVAHLRQAHQFAPLEHEITASLAHCLGNVGHLGEAEVLAKEAVEAAPRNRDHKDLLAWIQDGAKPCTDDDDAPKSKSPHTSKRRSRPRKQDEAVVEVLAKEMHEAGLPNELYQSALAVWKDYRRCKQLRVSKPEAYAAAIEYAVILVHGVAGVSRASIAKRYGVAAHTLSNRYNDVQEHLDLRPGDPRYAAL